MTRVTPVTSANETDRGVQQMPSPEQVREWFGKINFVALVRSLATNFNHTEQEDIAQDACEKILRSVSTGSFETPGKLLALARLIVLQKVKDAARRRTTRRRYEQDAAMRSEANVDARANEVEFRDIWLANVLPCVEELAERQRLAIE